MLMLIWAAVELLCTYVVRRVGFPFPWPAHTAPVLTGSTRVHLPSQELFGKAIGQLHTGNMVFLLHLLHHHHDSTVDIQPKQNCGVLTDSHWLRAKFLIRL